MPHSQKALDLVRRLVSTSVDGRVQTGEIDEKHNLHEFGIDSLATVSLLVALARETDVNLEDFIDDLDSPKTVSDLSSLADRFLSKRPIEA